MIYPEIQSAQQPKWAWLGSLGESATVPCVYRKVCINTIQDVYTRVLSSAGFGHKAHSFRVDLHLKSEWKEPAPPPNTLHHPERGDSLAGLRLLVQYMQSYLILFYEVYSAFKVHFLTKPDNKGKVGHNEHGCRWQVMVMGARGSKRLWEKRK